MQVDESRWRALLAALANANDTSPAFGLLQQAHGRWSRARADLEKFKARGPTGQASARNPDLNASFQRDVQELEQRVAEGEREVKRIEALHRQAGTRRSALEKLVNSCREWAAGQSPPVVLPGDDTTQVSGSGFAPSSVRVSTPPAREQRAWP